MSVKLKTYYFSYGLGGGDWHASSLKSELSKLGLSDAKPSQADIIIAHSAGCWLIPPNSYPKLIFYIGMPLAQDNVFETWRKVGKTSAATGFGHYIITGLKSIFYLAKEPRRNYRIIRQARTALPVIFNCPTVFIAGRLDWWVKGTKLDDYLKTKPWSFVSLDATHDQLWYSPADYAAIIKHFKKLVESSS